MPEFLPNKPSTQVKADDWVMKDWFDSLWRYSKGENRVAPVQTANFQMDLDYYCYPVSGSGLTGTLPPAANCGGKKYAVKSAYANRVTVVPTAGDTIDGAASKVVLNGGSTVFISDGINNWYVVGNDPVYSENNFTPIWTFNGANVGLTYGLQQGTYTKIGRLVTFSGRIILTAKGVSVGNVLIGNLPFTVGSYYSAWTTGYYAGFAGLTSPPMGYITPGTTYITLQQYAAASVANLTEAHTTNTSDIIFSGFYET